MIGLSGRLEQQQALIRFDRVETPALAIARQGRVVLLGVVAEQRQAEAALPLKGAVAAGAIAAHAAEQAHDVPLEVNFFDLGPVRQRDLCPGGGSGAEKESEDRTDKDRARQNGGAHVFPQGETGVASGGGQKRQAGEPELAGKSLGVHQV
jgi:hypothetical protein